MTFSRFQDRVLPRHPPQYHSVRSTERAQSASERSSNRPKAVRHRLESRNVDNRPINETELPRLLASLCTMFIWARPLSVDTRLPDGKPCRLCDSAVPNQDWTTTPSASKNPAHSQLANCLLPASSRGQNCLLAVLPCSLDALHQAPRPGSP